MKQEFLSFFPHTDMTALGLMIFLFIFIGVLFWVFRKGSSEIYQQLSQQPLGKSEREGGVHE